VNKHIRYVTNVVQITPCILVRRVVFRVNFSGNARELSSLTFLDSGNAVPTEMNGPTGTQSSQQFPQDFRSLITTYVTYIRQNT